MVVSKKKILSFQDTTLEVDSWNLKHEENGIMNEKLVGKVKIYQEKYLLYLGHVLSQDGGTMHNILNKK